MTGHDSQGAPKTKAEQLANMLRAEILDEHVIDTDHLGGQVATDRELDDAIDALMQQMEVPVRREFQVALSQRIRSIMEVRRWSLPQLLEVRRAASGLSREQVAQQLNISESDVRALETGGIPLWKAPLDNPVELALRWIRSLSIDAAQAKRATKRLLPRAPAPAYSDAGNSGEYEEAAAFVRGLTESLDQLASAEGG
jgi:transcriptional regulator with XRE-family HTH domain